MSKTLILYDKACRALAAAREVDEVKDVLDKSVALKAYARQSKDERLMADATVIQHRATRRLGEVMAERKAEGKLSKGAATTRGEKNPASLDEQGVDKNLAKRARVAAAMPEEQFEAEVAEVTRLAVATVIGDRATLGEARARRQEVKRERRATREAQLGARLSLLPDKKFGVILADPPWRFEPYSAETGMDRSAENHYPTQTLDDILALDVAAIAGEDCALFLWATAPMLPQALRVMAAWGFGYRTHAVWVKSRLGTGYWFRNAHELVLLGARGEVPAPAMGDQFTSVFETPDFVGRHSQKPESFHQVIERYFPSLPKLELYRRGEPRPGWSAWGLEAETGEEAA